jgi:hypothetical protein
MYASYAHGHRGTAVRGRQMSDSLRASRATVVRQSIATRLLSNSLVKSSISPRALPKAGLRGFRVVHRMFSSSSIRGGSHRCDGGGRGVGDSSPSKKPDQRYVCQIEAFHDSLMGVCVLLFHYSYASPVNNNSIIGVKLLYVVITL